MKLVPVRAMGSPGIKPTAVRAEAVVALVVVPNPPTAVTLKQELSLA